MSKRSNPEVKRLVEQFKNEMTSKWFAGGDDVPEGTINNEWFHWVMKLARDGAIGNELRMELNRVDFKLKKVFCPDGMIAETF